MYELKIPARVDRLDDVLEFIGKAVNDAGMDGKFRSNINIAVEEIFVNIAHYAYPSGEGDVIISASVTPDNLIFELSDSGTPYDPLGKDDPDITLSAEEREIGGLGIFMVKKLVDDVSYRYEDGKNILTLSKRRS